MPVLVDFHVLAQALVYFVSVACGLVISIPLGVTTVNFQGYCLLYTECSWKNDTYFTVDFTPGSTCKAPVYISVFVGILYAVGMGIYYVYALTRKDPNIGSQMWVWPFTLASCLVTVTFFVVACIISVGFRMFCDSYVKGSRVSSCADAQHVKTWHGKNDSIDVDGSTFYAYLHASQGAAWVMFLVWTVQVGLGILRIIRNRRLRSEGMYDDLPGETVAGGGKKAADLANVAAADPTA